MSEESMALPNALELASDLEDDNFRGNTTQVVNVLRHLAEDYEVSRRDYDVMYKFYKAANELLKEAYSRFQQYEMDVDDHPPSDHVEFMKKLRAEIDA